MARGGGHKKASPPCVSHNGYHHGQELGEAGQSLYQIVYVSFLLIITILFVLFVFILPISRKRTDRNSFTSNYPPSEPGDVWEEGDDGRSTPDQGAGAVKISFMEKDNSNDRLFKHTSIKKGKKKVKKKNNDGKFLNPGVSLGVFFELCQKFGKNISGVVNMVKHPKNLLLAAQEGNRTCRYFTNNDNPFLLLQPVKVEQVLEDPYMVIIHDLLNHKQISNLIQLAQPRLFKPDCVFSSMNRHNIRESQIAYLDIPDNRMMLWINHFVGTLTGLDMSTSEPVQVEYYQTGGYYMPHADFLIPGKSPINPVIGNRVATMVMHLNDVEEGGATVFPFLNVRISPLKGSALLWFNIRRSGQLDERTVHGECQVTAGDKWAGNIWIGERGQEFKRPCGKHNNI